MWTAGGMTTEVNTVGTGKMVFDCEGAGFRLVVASKGVDKASK